jgi:hypothetical protein
LDFAATLIAGLCALAVFIATQSFGRIAGISTAAACGVSLAFFTMDPVFSFEIASPVDRGTLLAYGVTSFLLLLRKPRRNQVRPERVAWPSGKQGRTQEIDFAGFLEAAVAQTWPDTVDIDIDPRMRIPGSGDEIQPLLNMIMRAGVPDLVPVRIAAYSGTAPGQTLVWVALQYKPWPDEPHVFRIGRHRDGCARLETPNPEACSVSWFDNGFERVFQICLTLYADC